MQSNTCFQTYPSKAWMRLLMTTVVPPEVPSAASRAYIDCKKPIPMIASLYMSGMSRR